jgi:hypothetical protein
LDDDSPLARPIVEAHERDLLPPSQTQLTFFERHDEGWAKESGADVSMPVDVRMGLVVLVFS